MPDPTEETRAIELKAKDQAGALVQTLRELAKRYPSARSLVLLVRADELQHYLRNEPAPAKSIPLIIKSGPAFGGTIYQLAGRPPLRCVREGESDQPPPGAA